MHLFSFPVLSSESKRHPIPTTPHLILKVIIHRRPFTLRHALLLPIHLRNLPRTRSHIWLLILSYFDKPWKPQTNPLFPAPIHALLPSRLVPWAQCEIRCLHLPHVLAFKPDIWLVLVAGRVRVEWFGTVDDDGGELRVQFFQHRLGESGANVADGLVRLGGWVVAGEEESAVDGGTFATTVVRA